MRTIFAAICLSLFPFLAFANGYETYPTPLVWSPDSTLLASVEAESWPYNDGLVTGALRLYHFDGTPLHELVAGSSVGSPAFSPDGHLACVHNGKIAIFEGYLESSSVRFINVPAPALDCTFASLDSGRTFIFASLGERFYGADVWRVSLDGTQLTQFTQAGPSDSAFTPLGYTTNDASYILHLHQYGSGGGDYTDDSQWNYTYERYWIKTLHANDYRNGRLTDEVEAGVYPDSYHESNAVRFDTGDEFSPYLIFQRGGWGNWDLYLMDRNFNESLELQDAQQPSVSADGRWLAFVRRPAYAKAQLEYDWEVVPQIWLADRQCRELWHLNTSIAGGEFPAVSPDGSRLAWLEYNDGKVRTRVREVAEIVSDEPLETY